MGNLLNKHGIFRILPTAINTTDGKKIKLPIELISITDFSGKPYKFQTINNYYDDTITWKIGDSSVTAKGESEYKIIYRVKNVIRSHPNFDELYWNINGNFWDLEIDNFMAEIKFPVGINKENVILDYYTGFLDEKNKDLATYEWQDSHSLRFKSTRTLKKGEGITISAIFPKGIVAPYKFDLVDNFGWGSLWIIVPVATFIICFLAWKNMETILI